MFNTCGTFVHGIHEHVCLTPLVMCIICMQLMHQIDVLISGKQAEWAGQWAGLETQLREKERELAAVRHTLWERDTQVTCACTLYLCVQCHTSYQSVQDVVQFHLEYSSE